VRHITGSPNPTSLATVGYGWGNRKAKSEAEMKQDIKPSTIMLIAGGAVLFISTFLAWFSIGSGSFGASSSGWSTESYGLTGIFVAVIGLAIAIAAALTAFTEVEIPSDILGFTREQVYCMLGLAAFLITFGLQFGSATGIGILLGWIASAVVVAGAYIEMQASGAAGAAPAAPPSQF